MSDEAKAKIDRWPKERAKMRAEYDNLSKDYEQLKRRTAQMRKQWAEREGELLSKQAITHAVLRRIAAFTAPHEAIEQTVAMEHLHDLAKEGLGE